MAGKEALTVLAVGDVFINRPTPPSILKGVKALLGGADLILANQEGPVTDQGQPILGKIEAGSRHIRAVPASIPAEAEAGFSAVTLANNHMMDYGEEGLFQTMALLREHGIPFTGAGASFEEARRPVLLEQDGTKIAMLGYTSVYPVAGFAAGPKHPGVATVKVHTAYRAPENVFYQPGFPAITVTTPDALEMEAMLADIRRARQVADIVVVQFHWGVAQGHGRVVGYMKEMGRAAVDAGADLILGHHPHLLLGFEFYRERLICYSLNHFAFDIFVPWHGWLDTVALKAVIREGRFQRFSVIPVTLAEKTMDLGMASGERWQAIYQEVQGLSQEFGTTLTPDGEELVLGGPAPGTPPPLRAPEVLEDNPLLIPYPTSRGKGMMAFFEH
jgi:poly-gamma-glutamate synthesis protein (capsule biosynthesis protein)